MGLLDRLLGADLSSAPVVPSPHRRASDRREPQAPDDVVGDYRRVVRTAPAANIEQAHREAFSRLSESQRAMIYEELSRGAHTGERPLSSEPATLARAATRAELRIPGSIERAVRGSQPEVARNVVSSPLVSAFLPWRAAS